MSGTLHLELARAPDAPAMAQMSRDLIETGLGWKYQTQTLLRSMADADTLTLAARNQGDLVGFAMAQFVGERTHLALLAVKPSHQRQGVGRQLMQWLLASAAAAGIAAVELELRAANRSALAFYESLGFSEIARVAGYYRRQESAIRMRLVLRHPDFAAPAWQAPTLRRS